MCWLLSLLPAAWHRTACWLPRTACPCAAPFAVCFGFALLPSPAAAALHTPCLHCFVWCEDGSLVRLNANPTKVQTA